MTYFYPLFLILPFPHVRQVTPLLLERALENERDREIPMGDNSGGQTNQQNFLDRAIARAFPSNPEFFVQAMKFTFCFLGLQASYLTWGYMQELIMTTQFKPTDRVPSGKFPSAAFCVFSNRFLAVIVAMLCVRIKHGTVFNNNAAPLLAYTPCALSNTMSSWSQYASLKYVSFPVQTVFKSSKIIPVMIMGMLLKGTRYPLSQYLEAVVITMGVAVFSMASKKHISDQTDDTAVIGLIFLVLYVCFDSFTSQWQDRVYSKYGRENVDQYQMMLGVNTSAIIITTFGLLVTGDFPVVYEFLAANPKAFTYNVITAVTSASGQLCIFYTIKEFGPIAFTVIMTTRQMFSICISAIVFKHPISSQALAGAFVVFAVLFWQIRGKYMARKLKKKRVVSSKS
jgi:solute carrier family 35 (adenosine 3'-phospho 5'-phosphosulfate transporter), member B2